MTDQADPADKRSTQSREARPRLHKYLAQDAGSFKLSVRPASFFFGDLNVTA